MKVCKVEGCNNKVHGNGYCGRHYKQIRKYGKIIKTRYDKNEIIKHEDYAEIILLNIKNEEVARVLIDIDDIEKVNNYKWHLSNNGYASSKCKATNNKNILLHRFLLDCPDDMVVDHINHNILDNRKSNLRVCTHQQNMMNQNINSVNTSGYKGVSWNKRKEKWEVYIDFKNKRIKLGYYISKEEAIKVRKQAEIKYFGEFMNKELD